MNRIFIDSWHLRSLGDNVHSSETAYVCGDGHIHVSGIFVNVICGVRPTMWIKL